jgi:hypothetical protein
MEMIFRKFYVTARNSSTPDVVRYGDTITAFTAEEAIREAASQSRFSGGPQGHPSHNYNPEFPILFVAQETQDKKG